MSDFIKALFVIGLLVVGCKFVNNQYVKECEVIEVADNVVVVETSEGDLFEFFGNDFTIGDIVNVTFSDNDTIGIQDDFIIDCEKCTNLT